MSALVTHNGIEKGRWFSFLSDNGDDGGENATSSCLGIPEAMYQLATPSMQLLRDNLLCWLKDDDSD